MKIGLRIFFLICIFAILTKGELFSQAAIITGWRHPDFVYCATEGGDTLIGASPSGKPFYINGVSYTLSTKLVRVVNGVAIFYPSLAGVGTHTIVYGTIGSHDVTVTVTVQNLPPISLAPFSNVCANAIPYSLFNSDSSNVSPKGGTFSGTGVNASGIFDPATAGPGTHTITYTVQVGSCGTSVQRTITVLPVPVVGISPFSPICQGSSSVLLTQGYPAGGTYSGPGVDAAGNFDQSVTGLGIFPITYSYSNGTCGSSATRDIVVAAKPIVSFSGLGAQYCTDDAGAGLTGNPAGVTGLFNGPGITDNGDGTAVFEPAIAGLGLHPVSYVYTNAQGCSDTAVQNVQVGTNVLINGLSASYCVNNSDVLISGSPAGGTFSPVQGLTDNANGTAVFSPSTAGSGFHTITYTYTDANGCINVRSQQVRIYALPVPAILNLAGSYCANTSPVTITGNYNPSGSFSGAATSDNGNGTAVFLPASLLPGGPYSITYTYTDPVSGCQASTTNQVVINSIPAATLSGNSMVCQGNPSSITISLSGNGPFNINYTDGTGTYTLNNIAGPSYTAQVYPPDTTIYHLAGITDNRGCTTAGAGSATVNVLPVTVITGQPESHTVCPGSNVQFSVLASGVNLLYQWQKDGADIAGANSPALTLNNVQPADLGIYKCTIVGTCGPAVSSNDALLSFWSPTVLTLNPVSAHECAGENIGFTVAATGSNLSYQWYKNNQIFQDTSNYLGTTTNTLFINTLTPANAGNYHCVINGSCGTVVTIPAVLEVDRNIVITEQPVSVSACNGSNISFSVTASGDNLTYQWQKNNLDIPGASSSTLTVNNIGLADEGFYRCMIRSVCGNILFSNSADLVIETVPVIGVNPVNLIRCEGDNAVFSVSASGSGLNYQWFRDGVVVANNARISGATASSLVINQVAGVDAGTYSCTISNNCSILNTSPATLVVDTALFITAQPADVHACEGDNVFFTLSATGNNVFFQWYKDGLVLPGQTSATLAVNNAGISNQGIYTCVVSNSCGKSITSNPARLFIEAPVEIALQPADVEACTGNNALFFVQSTGTGVSYQWEFNGTILADGGNVSGAQSATLIIQNINEENEGVYNCMLTGFCGSERSLPASLMVNERLTINVQPAGDTVCTGNTVQFRIDAGGAVHYQWQKDEINLPGENTSILLLNNVSTSDSGIYRCLVFSSCDTLASDGAWLTVKTHPAVTVQPISVNVCESGSAELTAEGTGSDVAWRWFKDGTVLSEGNGIRGTNSAVLVFDSVTTAYNGIYSARLSGFCGIEQTHDAVLTVIPGPVIAAQPYNRTVCETQSASFSVTAWGIISYQWQKDNTDLPGMNNATLVIANTALSDQGIYRCKMTSACGEIFSEGALLSVNPAVSVTLHPENVMLCEGNSATIHFAATGNGLTYQWKFNGVTITDNDSVSGSTTASLVINPAAPQHSGIYHGVVAGNCGTVMTDPAVVTVWEKIDILVQPQSIASCTGQGAAFEVQATGATLTYQWQKNGAIIPGATSSSYSIGLVAEADTGLYRCVISGSCGQIISDGARLSVEMPPVILTQPQQTITSCAGGLLSVNTVAQGSHLQYRWLFNGNPLSDDGIITGSSTAMLIINNANESHEGLYLCQVANTCAAVVTNGTQVWINQPAVITEQPVNTDACSGEDITLTIAAEGTGLFYQWQKGTADIPGVVSPVLNISAATEADSGTYRCLVSSVCGTEISEAVRITVSQPLSIVMHPAALLTSCEGTQVTLAITTSGDALSYVWKKNGINLNNNARISGAQSAALRITALTTGDEGNYTCEVTGICNTVSTPVTRLDVLTVPVVLFHPADYSVLEGGHADFNVTASGDSLMVQWQFNSLPLSDGAGVAGSGTDHLSITGVTSANTGTYNAVVSGFCGTVASNPASLTLLSSSIITDQPEGAVKCEGESVSFTTAAAGSPHTYQWKKNGTNLSDNGNITGTQQATLNITNLMPQDAGSYHCLVDGVENSIPALLYVNRNTRIDLASGSADLCTDELITLLVEATGDSLEYSWYKDGSMITDIAGISGSATPVVSIFPASITHSGSYNARVTGACGTANGEPQIIHVSSPVSVISQPDDTIVCEKQSIHLSIQVSGSGITYQWLRNGVPLNGDGRISGVNSSVLTISVATLADQGAYSCIVEGSCNTVYSNTAYVTVNPVGEITVQPVSLTLCSTNQATFLVNTNLLSAGYQWQRDGVNLTDDGRITGSLTNVLHISNTATSDNGVYQCVITGPCDEIFTNPVQLTVNNSPQITTQPISGSVCEGGLYSFEVNATGTSLAYQWSRNGQPLTDGSGITGAQTRVLAISNAVLAHAGTYACVITGICGNTVSDPAILAVNEITAITIHPLNTDLCANNGMTLIVAAKGTGNIYQWEKDNVALTDVGGISGSTTQMLNIVSVDPVNAGVYRCIVTGTCNSQSSQPAAITITIPPTVTVQPAGATLCEEQNLLLQTETTGNNLSFQWKKDGTSLNDGNNISGAFTAALQINPVDISNSGSYTCEVFNTCGHVNTDPAVILVDQKGVITAHPVSSAKCMGDAVSFSVSVAGNNLSYLWEFNGAALVEGGRIFGTQTAVLTISNVNLTDAGIYRCIITDNCGLTQNSDPATLTIHVPTSVTSLPAGDTLCEGQSCTLTIQASGSNLAYRWYRDGTPLSDGPGITGVNTNSLIINSLTIDRSGYYHCEISGSCGLIVTPAIPVMVNQPVRITEQPVNAGRCEGDMVIFSIRAEGDSLNYQWVKDGVTLSDGPGTDGTSSSLLILTGLTASSTGSYSCVVSGACGQVYSNPGILTVNVYPGAAGPITGPSVVCQGSENVVYSIAAIPDADFYEWLLPPGAVITSGENTREIEVTFVDHELGGPLSVRGINGCGQGPSSPVLTVVANPLPVTYAGENTGICSDQVVLSAYPPETGATGSWQVLGGPAAIQQPLQPVTQVNNLRIGANPFSWTVTKNGCSVTDTITINNNQLIVDAGKDTSICNHIYTLNAAAPVSGIGEWSIISGAGYNINRYNPNTIVSGLAQGRNIFKWSVNNNGCISYDTVIITNNLPTESNAGPDQAIHADYTNLNANNPAIGTGEWYLINGSGSLADRRAYNTLATGLGRGSNVFEWLITHNGCASSDTVIIENILTDTTDAGVNQIICSTSVRLSARNPYPGYGEWSVKRGSATFANNSLYNTTAYNLGQGENVLIWTAYLNGVTSDSVIIVNNLPTTANAGVNLSICADSVRLNANLPYIGSGSWAIASGSGTFENALSNTTIVRNLARGNNNFRWTITNGTCMSTSLVTITNNTPTDAEAGFDAVTCEDTIVLNPNVPTFGVGEWRVLAGSARFTGNVARDLGRDNNYLVYSIRNAGCYSYDTLIITSHKPTIARLGADMSICTDSVWMVANVPVTGNGVWSLQSGSADIEDLNAATTMARDLGAGEHIFRWTITYLECSTYDESIISNDFVQADAGFDQVLCSDRTVLQANDAGYSSGYWTLTGGATGAAIADPHSANTIVENLAKGTNILRWTISKNSCSSYDEVSVVNNLPTRAFAGQDTYLCQDHTQLHAGTVLQGQGTWSILSGSGNISDLHDPLAVITDLAPGANILRWTTDHAGCVLTDEVIINNNLPIDVFAGEDQTLCSATASLYANPPVNGNGSWSFIRGSATLADNELYNTAISNLSNGSNILKWTVSTTGCSVTDTVIITNNLPSLAIAGSDFAVCNGAGYLSANTPLYGTGTWSVTSGSGNIEYLHSPFTAVTELALGMNTLLWTITNQNCISSDEIMVVNNSPTIADAGSDAEVCGGSAILFANSPVVGTGYWEVISGKGDFADSLNFNTTVNGLIFGENTLRWTTRNGECISDDDIVITNNLASVYAGEDLTVYEPVAALTGNNPEGGNGEWVLIAGNGSFLEPNSFMTTVNNLGAGINTFEWTITLGSCVASDQVMVNYKAMPKIGFLPDQTEGCPGLTVAFANTTQYGTTYQWDLGDGVRSDQVNVIHTYNYPGSFVVRLTAFGPDNRTVWRDTIITVHRPPVADFQFAPDTVFVNKPMRCYDYSYGASAYTWDFGDTHTSLEINPMHYYENSGNYTITLSVVSAEGCTDTASAAVFVAEDGIIVFPNAFTPDQGGPNGGHYSETDRSNDVFHPYHENVADYRLEIYSRWGVLLFESKDVNIGWDGYYKGELLAKDVYVWKASGRYVSGSEFLRTGTVLLIK